MSTTARTPGRNRPSSSPADRLSVFVGRQVRPTARSARERNLSLNQRGVITQVIDLGYALMIRVRGLGADFHGDFTPDELEVLD